MDGFLWTYEQYSDFGLFVCTKKKQDPLLDIHINSLAPNIAPPTRPLLPSTVPTYTVIRFISITVVLHLALHRREYTVNRTLVEEKMRRFKGECAHFSFNQCPIYAHDGASAKFSTNSRETDNSAVPLDCLFEHKRTKIHG
jgi:hypothetical protein